MLKKCTLFLLLTAVVTSCTEIYYDSETRLVLQGKLVDKTGAPLSGIDVEIKITEGNDFGNYAASDVITSGYSDANGNFKFAIPAPENQEHTFSVNIKKNEDSQLQRKSFVMIKRKDFEGYRFNLNTISVYQPQDIAVLEIVPNTTISSHILTNVYIEGETAARTVAINPLPVNYATSQFFELLKNQTVVLHYTVYGDSATTPVDYSIPVVIGASSTVTYYLSY